MVFDPYLCDVIDFVHYWHGARFLADDKRPLVQVSVQPYIRSLGRVSSSVEFMCPSQDFGTLMSGIWRGCS